MAGSEKTSQQARESLVLAFEAVKAELKGLRDEGLRKRVIDGFDGVEGTVKSFEASLTAQRKPTERDASIVKQLGEFFNELPTIKVNLVKTFDFLRLLLTDMLRRWLWASKLKYDTAEYVQAIGNAMNWLSYCVDVDGETNKKASDGIGDTERRLGLMKTFGSLYVKLMGNKDYRGLVEEHFPIMLSTCKDLCLQHSFNRKTMLNAICKWDKLGQLILETPSSVILYESLNLLITLVGVGSGSLDAGKSAQALAAIGALFQGCEPKHRKGAKAVEGVLKGCVSNGSKTIISDVIDQLIARPESKIKGWRHYGGVVMKPDDTQSKWYIEDSEALTLILLDMVEWTFIGPDVYDIANSSKELRTIKHANVESIAPLEPEDKTGLRLKLKPMPTQESAVPAKMVALFLWEPGMIGKVKDTMNVLRVQPQSTFKASSIAAKPLEVNQKPPAKSATSSKAVEREDSLKKDYEIEKSRASDDGDARQAEEDRPVGNRSDVFGAPGQAAVVESLLDQAAPAPAPPAVAPAKKGAKAKPKPAPQPTTPSADKRQTRSQTQNESASKAGVLVEKTQEDEESQAQNKGPAKPPKATGKKASKQREVEDADVAGPLENVDDGVRELQRKDSYNPPPVRPVPINVYGSRGKKMSPPKEMQNKKDVFHDDGQPPVREPQTVQDLSTRASNTSTGKVNPVPVVAASASRAEKSKKGGEAAKPVEKEPESSKPKSAKVANANSTDPGGWAKGAQIGRANRKTIADHSPSPIRPFPPPLVEPVAPPSTVKRDKGKGKEQPDSSPTVRFADDPPPEKDEDGMLDGENSEDEDGDSINMETDGKHVHRGDMLETDMEAGQGMSDEEDEPQSEPETVDQAPIAPPVLKEPKKGAPKRKRDEDAADEVESESSINTPKRQALAKTAAETTSNKNRPADDSHRGELSKSKSKSGASGTTQGNVLQANNRLGVSGGNLPAKDTLRKMAIMNQATSVNGSVGARGDHMDMEVETRSSKQLQVGDNKERRDRSQVTVPDEQAQPRVSLLKLPQSTPQQKKSSRKKSQAENGKSKSKSSRDVKTKKVEPKKKEIDQIRLQKTLQGGILKPFDSNEPPTMADVRVAMSKVCQAMFDRMAAPIAAVPKRAKASTLALIGVAEGLVESASQMSSKILTNWYNSNETCETYENESTLPSLGVVQKASDDGVGMMIRKAKAMRGNVTAFPEDLFE